MNPFSKRSFAEQKVLLRVDFNVPIKSGQITDASRIDAALPTIRQILQTGGSVILMSHWGRPLKEMAKNPERKPEDFSLRQIVSYLSEALEMPVDFAEDAVGTEAIGKAGQLRPGGVLLLENLRLHPEEEKGDPDFARQLAELGTFYVNDAFGTAHRAHASTAIIARFFPETHRCPGLLMERETRAADQVLHQSRKPFVAIIGGAKVSDKILIIENLLEKATDIIIGGGMAYTFFKASGGQIGNSLCEDDRLDTARALLEKAKAKQVAIHLPEDSVIADAFSGEANKKTADNQNIPAGWMGLDIGPKAITHFSEIIGRGQTILWNGPMGVFEIPAFQKGTKAIAEAVSQATTKGAYSLVGGGDSVAAVNLFGLSDAVSYVSTGGGALLEYFEGKELPGIAALK